MRSHFSSADQPTVAERIRVGVRSSAVLSSASSSSLRLLFLSEFEARLRLEATKCGCSYFLGRAGCATSEELFWKLGALQSFIRDIHWPDADFAKHLEQRLKLMAFDMLEATVSGTVQAFQVSALQTSYFTPLLLLLWLWLLLQLLRFLHRGC